jgi:hypothetical protein
MHGVSDGSRLERRFRRWLAWYPAEHRRVYGEEMIGVLLASTPHGRSHPRAADVVALVRGGIITRIRTAADLDQDWRDAMAVASVIMPVIFAAFTVITYSITLIRLLSILHSPQIGLIASRVLVVAVLTSIVLLPPFLARRGHRMAAVLSCVLPLGYVALVASEVNYNIRWLPIVVSYALVFLLEAVAVGLSPGPRRATELLARKSWVVACGIGVALAALRFAIQQPYAPAIGSWAGAGAVLLVGLAAAAAVVLTIPSPVAKRLLVLLAIPAYPGAIAVAGPRANAAVLVLAAVAALVAWRTRPSDRDACPGGTGAAT